MRWSERRGGPFAPATRRPCRLFEGIPRSKIRAILTLTPQWRSISGNVTRCFSVM